MKTYENWGETVQYSLRRWRFNIPKYTQPDSVIFEAELETRSALMLLRAGGDTIYINPYDV